MAHRMSHRAQRDELIHMRYSPFNMYKNRFGQIASGSLKIKFGMFNREIENKKLRRMSYSSRMWEDWSRRNKLSKNTVQKSTCFFQIAEELRFVDYVTGYQ
jgi:hypothetical protein